MIPGFWVAWILKATALFAFTWLVSLALRRASAAVRHQVWAVALLGSLILPGLMWTLPAWRTSAVTIVTPALVEEPLLVSGTNAVSSRNAGPPPPIFTTGQTLALVWFGGFLIVLARLGAGLLQVRRWQRGARALSPPPGFPPRIRLLESPASTAMPLTWGLLRPCVLLPAGWREWPEVRLRHVLAHEAAHVNRRDWAVQISAELACAVCWFHPLVWIVVRGLRQEAERACDDLVLAGGADASDYAEHLVQLARGSKSPAGAVSATLAVARPSSLERRITAMLNASVDRRPVSSSDKWMYLLLSGLMLAPLAALAQTPEIRGVVMDPGTNHGIGDAEITVNKMDPREIGRPLTSNEVAKLETDAQGSFVFRPDDFGEYVLRVQKEGFSAITGTVPGIPSTQINVVLTKDRPSREVRFVLGRPGEVTGRVVDYDTGAPIPNFHVNIAPLLYTRGRRIFWRPAANAVTNAEGRFRAPNLAPNQYIAEIVPQFPENDTFLKEFSAADATTIDQDYEHIYLPGGPELDSALPVSLASGASVDIGTLRARKAPRYRALVAIADTNCAAGAAVQLNLFLKSPLSGATGLAAGQVECGKQVLFRNLAPGEYWLSARIWQSPAAKVLAEVPIVLTNRNEALRVTLAKGTDIIGRLIATEGARTLDWAKMQLRSTVINSINFGEEAAPASADAEGRFRFENRLPGIKVVSVIGLPQGTFVKQMRYRGIPLATNIFTFTGDGELEIEIDDQPATVTGSVRSSSSPVESAHVALIRWPMDTIEPFGSITRANADADGRFQFSSLPPGEYRLLALTPENRDRLEEPGVLQRLLPRAEKVTLNRGGSQTVTLAPVDPER